MARRDRVLFEHENCPLVSRAQEKMNIAEILHCSLVTERKRMVEMNIAEILGRRAPVEGWRSSRGAVEVSSDVFYLLAFLFP